MTLREAIDYGRDHSLPCFRDLWFKVYTEYGGRAASTLTRQAHAAGITPEMTLKDAENRFYGR